ncbi:MAG: endonuclease/exonuclease/phosphatase family protein [Planctomycetes bacterium]|nr:endonuclease/exonuclease/phosphatase family protein [Planctomycetota bacterium]MBL7040217.1 endonuclease/exonuclease/phosphatase family protein [Pirellulaceae bacterium]
MPISRRQFCSFVGAAGLSTMGSRLLTHAAAASAAKEKASLLRVIAYNVYACTGWPKNRRLAQKAVSEGQMADRFALELALYDPDIINFSESPDETVVKQISEQLGMNYVRFPSGGNWPGTLLSRLKIVDSQNVPLVGGDRPVDLFTRHWGRATIQLSNGDPLIVHSAHLRPGADPGICVREIQAMLHAMRDELSSGRSTILMGDLNHGPTQPEYAMWNDAGWVDTFAEVGKGEGPTIKADNPQWRVDYVMAAGPIAEQVVESRPLFEGAFRTNPADANSFALSDHLPQFTVFELDAR